MHGLGTFVWPDQDKYEGEYKDGLRHGMGVFRWPDGREYRGAWSGDKRNGYGKFTVEEGPDKQRKTYAGNYC